MSTAITFDQMESGAENSLAWVLWAKNARNTAILSISLVLVNRIVRSYVASLTCDRLDSLSPEQAKEIKGSLQEMHVHLMRLLRHRGCGTIKSAFGFRASISGLEASAEDISDIIEDLILADNPKFVGLLQDCARAIQSEQTSLSQDQVGLVGRV